MSSDDKVEVAVTLSGVLVLLAIVAGLVLSTDARECASMCGSRGVAKFTYEQGPGISRVPLCECR